jgi:hypothetical protein
MPHPLSTIITVKLNGDDPHARTTITNAEAIHIRDWIDEANSIVNGAGLSLSDIEYCFGRRRDWAPIDSDSVAIWAEDKFSHAYRFRHRITHAPIRRRDAVAAMQRALAVAS